VAEPKLVSSPVANSFAPERGVISSPDSGDVFAEALCLVSGLAV
jgi:hypothetical protein